MWLSQDCRIFAIEAATPSHDEPASMMRPIALLLACAIGLSCAMPTAARTAPAKPPDAAARHGPDQLRSAMMAIVPPRLVVGAVSVEDDRGRIPGTAKTQARLSDFLRAIDRAGDVRRAELRSIRMVGDPYASGIERRIAGTHDPAPSGPRPGIPPPGKANAVNRCRIDGTPAFQATPCAPGQEG